MTPSRTLTLLAFLLLLCACNGNAGVYHGAFSDPVRTPKAHPETPAPNLPLAKRSVLYANNRLGFTVQMPKYVSAAGSCDYDPFPVNGYPLRIFKDGNQTVYIAPAFYGEMNGATCTNVENSLDAIQQVLQNRTTTSFRGPGMEPAFSKDWYDYGWAITVQDDVQHDADLVAFVRSEFGSGCDIGVKKESKEPGTFDVRIVGDTSGATPTCPLGFRYALKYSPAAHKVAAWKIGQKGRFDGLDADMAKTFRFN